MQRLLINTTAKARRVTRNGRDYLVAPLTMIVPGVLNGSKGALFYPPEQVAQSARDWEGVPLVVYHPTAWDGKHLSAYDPEAKGKHIGSVRNVHFAGKLRAEGWFDVEHTARVDRRVLESLMRGERIELSTGLYTENVPAPPGANYQGRAYTHIAKNYRPDHLAVLPDQVGACSLADGCGVLVNRRRKVSRFTRNFDEAKVKRDHGRFSSTGGSSGGAVESKSPNVDKAIDLTTRAVAAVAKNLPAAVTFPARKTIAGVLSLISENPGDAPSRLAKTFSQSLTMGLLHAAGLSAKTLGKNSIELLSKGVYHPFTLMIGAPVVIPAFIAHKLISGSGASQEATQAGAAHAPEAFALLNKGIRQSTRDTTRNAREKSAKSAFVQMQELLQDPEEMLKFLQGVQASMKVIHRDMAAKGQDVYNYDPDQKRDESGRWSSSTGDGSARKGVIGKTVSGVMGAYRTGKKAVGDLGMATWKRLPEKVRVPLRAAKKSYDYLHHKMESAYKIQQKAALAIARERGYTPEQTARLARALAIGDGVSRWTANVPVAHHALETLAHLGGPASFALAKTAFALPVASLAYTGYSTARNPLATIRAARKAIQAARNRKATSDTHTANWFATDVDRLVKALEAHDFGDWWEALYHAALDETGDAREAIELANQVASLMPDPGMLSDSPVGNDDQVRRKFSQRGRRMAKFSQVWDATWNDDEGSSGSGFASAKQRRAFFGRKADGQIASKGSKKKTSVDSSPKYGDNPSYTQKQKDDNAKRTPEEHDDIEKRATKAMKGFAKAGDDESAYYHKKLAQFHKTEAARKRAAARVGNRRGAIDFITANCECWSDSEPLLKSLSNNQLLWIVANMSDNDNDDDDDDSTDNDNDMSPTRLFKKKPKVKAMPKVTANEWLESAPPEVQEVVQNALVQEQKQKAQLVRRLIANAAPENKKRLADSLSEKSLAELQDLASLIPGAPTTPPVANYFGASVGVFDVTANANSEFEDDILPLPTMNWDEEGE